MICFVLEGVENTHILPLLTTLLARCLETQKCATSSFTGNCTFPCFNAAHEKCGKSFWIFLKWGVVGTSDYTITGERDSRWIKRGKCCHCFQFSLIYAQASPLLSMFNQYCLWLWLCNKIFCLHSVWVLSPAEGEDLWYCQDKWLLLITA